MPKELTEDDKMAIQRYTEWLERLRCPYIVKQDYQSIVDNSPKYNTKYGTWYNRLPLEHIGDDVEYAQWAIANWGDWECCYCHNPCGDHTAEELAVCLRIERDRESCPTCGKPDENHLDEEYRECMRTRPVLKKGTVSHIKQ